MKNPLSRRAAVLFGLGATLFCTAPAARAQDPAAAAQPAPAGASAPAADSVALDPQQAFDALHAALIDVMKRADELGYEGRYRLLEPIHRQQLRPALHGREVLRASLAQTRCPEPCPWC